MPRINSETTYNVELTDEEIEQLSRGMEVTFSLPDGNTMRLGGDGPSGEGPIAGSEDDVDPEEIEQLVQGGKNQRPDPQGGDTEGDENPHAGGMIDVERSE